MSVAVPMDFRLNAAHLRLPAPIRPSQNDAYCEYPQLAYSLSLKATFVELPAFEERRLDG